jgi:very-short-patch-repair endonuclease
LCVEIDGAGYARPRARREDRARDRTLRAAGYDVLRFTGEDLDERPGAVAAGVRAALDRLGWRS